MKQSVRPIQLSFVLEAKLRAVDHFHSSLEIECAQHQPMPSYETPVVELTETTRATATFEAYIGSIYSCLEVVAKLNECLHRNLPQSFSALSHRDGHFDRETNPWIPSFFDVRSEIVHYNMAFVVAADGVMHIAFKGSRKREHFEAGKHQLRLSDVLGYRTGLSKMLDVWALAEIEALDRSHPFASYAPVVGTGTHVRGSRTVGDALAAIGA